MCGGTLPKRLHIYIGQLFEVWARQSLTTQSMFSLLKLQFCKVILIGIQRTSASRIFLIFNFTIHLVKLKLWAHERGNIHSQDIASTRKEIGNIINIQVNCNLFLVVHWYSLQTFTKYIDSIRTSSFSILLHKVAYACFTQPPTRML